VISDRGRPSRLSYCGVGRPFRAGIPEKPHRNVRPVTGDTISYADGTAKTLNLGNAPASQSDMDKAKAAIPILRIVDQPGCEH
jgi:hypothetical protein